MASTLLKVGAGFVAGAAGGLAMTAASAVGNAQQRQPPPRQQPAPRVQNAPSWNRPAAPQARQQPAPGPSNRTLQAQAASQAAVAAAEAERAKAEAEARKAEAEAKAREREAEAAAKAKEAEEARKTAEAERAAQAEKDKLDREREKDASSTLLTVGAVALGAVALVAGLRGGAALAAKAAANAKDTVKAVNALGKEAAKLNKAKTLVAGTPKGDAMAGIVKEADALGRSANFANLGKPTAAAKVAIGLKVAGAVEVGASYALPAAAPALGMSQESADRASQLLRLTGAAFLGAGAGMKLGMTGAKAVRPSSRAVASINAGANRLAREGAGGAAKVSANRVGVEVARSSGKVRAAKSGASVTASRAQRKAVEAKGTVDRAKVRTAKSVTAERKRSAPARLSSKKSSWTRTYRSGPKAGMTETVTRH